jgi:hypothetical protein
MAPRTFSTCARQRLYTFARKLATPFTDSRRRRFLTEMIPGLVIANHVHLSKIAHAIGHGIENVHAASRMSMPPKSVSAATSAASIGT